MAIMVESEVVDKSERAHGLEDYIASGPSGKLPREVHVERARGGVGLGYTTKEKYVVGREKIREFSKCVFSNHPIHHHEDYVFKRDLPGLLAGPTFVGILGILAQRKLTEGFVSGYDISQIMQTEQRLEFHQPIFEGDEITIDVIFDSFREIAGTDILVTKNILYNQRDEKVLSSWTTLIARVVDEDHRNNQIEEAVKGVIMHD